MSEVEPQPLPYTGIMVQGLEEQNEKQAKLEQQAVEVNVNGTTETIRPEAIFIRGVDSMSTKNIEAFVNYYLNYETKTVTDEETGETKTSFESLPFEEQIHFRVQWVNDSSVNIAFSNQEDAIKALESISITSSNPAIPQEIPDFKDENSAAFISSLIQERETKPYNPVIEFQKRLDLATRLGIVVDKDEDAAAMDEDESAVVLHTRQSFQSDRKVKNAAAYSRYYLLHGEPERKPRRRNFKQHRGRTDRYRGGNRNNEDDLFADKLKSKADEEDLFADKLRGRRDRDRSPERVSRDRSRSPMRD